ncbi:hypothetical protein [Achromobacter sp. UMC71]|uniref:hypothetical protein n=1 Tax=Achromobacter sp. UMC71 TaxID=1862320 RepID=UPI0016049EC3|nr:hypothetical protein [Achromobacter sp. UMC71]MBB1625336.1 hypothetical protein [Achromobacter sp. UMC71]
MTLDAYFATIDSPAFAALGLLPRDRALELTSAMHGHPVVELLQGLVLDDPETSNHHLLLGRAPLTGRVLYLTHDGDSRVVFDSLADFAAAARQAGEQGVDMEELHPDPSPLVDGQPPLGSLIRELLQEDAGVEVVLALIPSLDLNDLALLEALARDDDFFLGEAVAMAIEKRPSQALRSIAVLCQAHPHGQVSRAGTRALQRIDALG